MSNQPLAERLRPKTLDDYIGQEHLVGKNAVLRKMIESGNISFIFMWVKVGFAAAVVATLPAFLSAGSDASFSTVTLVTGLILLNGFLWIFGLTWFSMQKKILVTGLRVE
jgi:replication-associated recombination protein RarA